MSIELGVSFFALTPRRACDALRALSQVPLQAGEALRDFELGWDPQARAVLARLALDGGGALEDVRRRVEFWLVRAGGRVRALDAMPRAAVFRGALARCALAQDDTTPEHVPVLLQRLVSGLRERPAFPAGAAPVLDMLVGGPGWEDVTYDDRSNALYVPAALTPPVGDELVLRLVGDLMHGGAVRVLARVAEVRRAEHASPGCPAGFLLELAPLAGAARAALAGAARPRPGARAAPRYRIRARARIARVSDGAAAVEGILRDLSAHGACVETALRPMPETRVRVSASLGASAELVTSATVARVGDGELGIRFEPDVEARAELDGALTRMVGRRRQVLVVDDDDRARRATADALGRRGFDVTATGDLVFGMQVLAAELAVTDALVAAAGGGGMGGAEVVRAVREATRDASFPIVLIEAGPQPARAHAGATRTLARSLYGEEIARAVDRLVTDPDAPALERAAADG